MRWYRKAQKQYFAPGEDPSKFGTPAVDIVGSEPQVFADIPGVEGHVNLQVSIEAVKNALEKVFGSQFFYPITTIKIQPLSGRFGEARSQEPHSIYINEQAMVDAVHKAVEREASNASQGGAEVAFTPEIGGKINREIAKLLWETIPHERRHAMDFQAEMEKLFSTGKGGPASVSESHGEQAGKAALSSFRWYVPGG
jgi:hypothetical protein